MNSELPITQYREHIVETVQNNPVTIIVAETGAGKSTQVPQYLLAANHDMVVTQPRRLAARSVARRVAAEMNEELGATIGLRTRDKQDQISSPETRCLFVTDGLALVRELMGSKQHGVLIIDEVHEWNLNIEVLVAWAKHRIENHAEFKLVLMSATIEADRLSEYFGNAPVITVPGRQYPVKVQQATASDLEGDVIKLLRAGRNVLVFQPGKKEIFTTIENLKQQQVSAEILPLHGELNPDEQQLCFRHYSTPKCIVSTNVAQTSVTIDDIDAVVDSGMERRKELINGVEGIYLGPISLADSDQRKGRAGRTKPGIYIDHCSARKRADFPTAEILRTRLDQTVLRLAEAGIDAEELTFFHQPDRLQIHEAREALKSLGCMDAAGQVTKIGHRVGGMPIGVKYARMIIEAERLGVVDDIIDIAAILEYGNSMTDRDNNSWYALIERESESDLLAQLKILRKAMEMDREQMKKLGIITKAFYKIMEIREAVREGLIGKIDRLESSGDREAIMKAIIAGMVDHLFQLSWGTSYTNGSSGERKLNRFSVIAPTERIVGVPFDLHFTKKLRYGGEIPMILHLINFATQVKKLDWLQEVAPQLYRTETGVKPYVDWNGNVKSQTVTYFRNQEISRIEVEDPKHPQAEILKRRNAEANQIRTPWWGRTYEPAPIHTPTPEELEARCKREEELQKERERIAEDHRRRAEARKLAEDLKAKAKLFTQSNFKRLDAFDRDKLAKISDGPKLMDDPQEWVAKHQPIFEKIKTEVSARRKR